MLFVILFFFFIVAMVIYADKYENVKENKIKEEDFTQEYITESEAEIKVIQDTEIKKETHYTMTILYQTKIKGKL